MKKLFKKKGSAYLMAIGVLGVLIIAGVTISKITTSGRWNTILTSNEKRAEECAEAASNLMFKIIKDNMNDDSVFYNNLPFPPNPIEILTSEYMYFRLPAFVTSAHLDGLSGFQQKGMDVQLDIFNDGLLKPVYDKGIEYYYDTRTTNAKGPLTPLEDMFKAYGGRVTVRCTAKIKQAFGILADNPKYKTAGVELPVKKATGFLSKLLDKILPSDADLSKITEPLSSCDAIKTEENDVEFDLASFIPDQPNFLECPDISNITVPGPSPTIIPIPIPVGRFIQPFLNKIWDEILDKITKGKGGITPRFLAETFFSDILKVKLPFGGVINKLKDCVNNLLPKELRAFAGNVSFGVTVEKKGFLEVETDLCFYPKASDEKHFIRKRLVTQREFRVADIQPIAPDYTFFVANSKLPYENENAENSDNWEGDECIDWDDGNRDLVLHNFPDLEKIIDTFENIIHNISDFKKLLRNIYLPGLVRVNGTKKMTIKIGLLPSFSGLTDINNLLKCEILSLALGHKSDTQPACHNKSHDKSHKLVPKFKKLPAFEFLSNKDSFDWPYIGGSSGGGSYWIPSMPRFPRNCLFGPLHISMPMSFRVEGYIKKVYSHLKIHLLYIFIPPFTIPWPYFHFPGINISLPWFWATKFEEPYGFCKWPSFDDESKASEMWDPNNYSNLPANLYSTAQYLKKASYYYNSSAEFTRDIDNRSIMEGEDKVFVCDGVTFVNDSTLNLPEMNVKGRGIIVCAGNIKIMGSIKRRDYGEGIPSLFSLVARNGAIQISSNAETVEACLYGDRGIQNSGKVKIDGNLVVNRFKRGDMHGEVNIHYNSRNCRSSLLSMIRPIAKYEPTRYHVTLSSKMSKFEFVKPE